jgi:calnexin
LRARLPSSSQGSFAFSRAPDYAAEGEEPGGSVSVTAEDGLELAKPARRYAVSAPLPGGALAFGDKPLVLQFEVLLQDGLECGGAYVKLFEAPAPGAGDFDATAVTPQTPYAIMFGPDRCGSTNKVHLIVRWRNPVSGVTEEKHLANAPAARSDRGLSHLYTLVLRPDATFAVKIDNAVEREGALGSDKDFSPPVLPPREVDDPEDRKPSDWVDEAKIDDPAAAKPDDWDESQPATVPDAAAVKPAGWLEDEAEYIADPSAVRPEGWDDEEDGEWVAPTVPNSKCEAAVGCGPWTRPSKPNPLYKASLQKRLAQFALQSHCSHAKTPTFFPLHAGQVGRTQDRQPGLQGRVAAAQDFKPALLRGLCARKAGRHEGGRAWS